MIFCCPSQPKGPKGIDGEDKFVCRFNPHMFLHANRSFCTFQAVSTVFQLDVGEIDYTIGVFFTNAREQMGGELNS